MKKEYIVILLLVLVIIGGFIYFKNQNSAPAATTPSTETAVTTPTPETPAATTPKPATTATAPKTTTTVAPTSHARSTTVKLLPKGDFGQSGTATITEVSSTRTKVVIRLDGAQTGTSRPVHFHKNRCDKFEEIIPITGFAPVNNGYSSSIVGASFDSLVYNKKYPYSIVIQKSQTEPQSAVSCGDIWGVIN